jgi:hypothetical protein
MVMRVGGDIGAICRKCGDVWHVVVAVVDGRIAKVECKQCGGRHRYRPADGAPATRVRRASGSATTRSTRAAGTRGTKLAKLIEADPSRPPRRYLATESYQQGDRMVHPNFGEGVVQAITGPTKVQVLFASGEKTLVHARKTAS